jgi:hypothetical protein
MTGTASFERTGEILGQLWHARILLNVSTQISLYSTSPRNKELAAILWICFAFIHVWGSSLGYLTFTVSRQEFGRRIFFEDFQPFINISNSYARGNMIQTVLLVTSSRDMPTSNVGWNTDYPNRCFSEISVLLGYYTAPSGNTLPTFRNNLSGPIFKGQEFFVLLAP